jgi:hypothetical protein
MRATIGLVEFVDGEHRAWRDDVLSLAGERFDRRLAEELGDMRVALVKEIHEARVETIKWVFLFWVGQMTAFAALLAVVFRLNGR